MNYNVLYRHAQFSHGEDVNKICYMFHGLFGSGSNLNSVARMVQPYLRPVIFDLPNHGKSPWLVPGDFRHGEHAVETSIAVDIAEFKGWEMEQVLRNFSENKMQINLLGHSLGAKYAMLYALKHPHRVRSLVVMDIAPIEYPPLHRRYFEAYQRIEKENIVDRREALRVFSEYESDKALVFFLAKNIYFENKQLRFYLNFNELYRNYDVLRSFPDYYDGKMYNGPVLFLRAEKTDYFPDTAEHHIARYFTNYRIITIPRSTHIVHIDNPDSVSEQLNEFYTSII